MPLFYTICSTSTRCITKSNAPANFFLLQMTGLLRNTKASFLSGGMFCSGADLMKYKSAHRSLTTSKTSGAEVGKAHHSPIWKTYIASVGICLYLGLLESENLSLFISSLASSYVREHLLSFSQRLPSFHFFF